MAYINTQTSQYPVTEYEIKAQFPNTAFPYPFTPPDGFEWVFPAPTPDYNSVTSHVYEGQPELINGQYIQTWVVDALVAEQVQANITAAGEMLKTSIVSEMENRLQAFVETRGYTSVDSMAKYKDITDEEIAAMPEEERMFVLQFRSECRHVACMTARTWARLYLLLGEVQAQLRPMPSSLSDFDPDLPVLSWPAAE